VAWRCLAPFGRFVVLGMASGIPGSLDSQVTAQITENLPLEGAVDAHRLLESRQSTGKLILKPWL
jgi:hypothetical protein